MGESQKKRNIDLWEGEMWHETCDVCMCTSSVHEMESYQLQTVVLQDKSKMLSQQLYFAMLLDISNVYYRHMYTLS